MEYEIQLKEYDLYEENYEPYENYDPYIYFDDCYQNKYDERQYYI